MAEGSLPHQRVCSRGGVGWSSVREGLWALAPNRAIIAVQHKTAAMPTQDCGWAATA